MDNADGAPLGPSPHETGSTKQPSLKPAANLNKGGRPKGKSKRYADLPRFRFPVAAGVDTDAGMDAPLGCCGAAAPPSRVTGAIAVQMSYY